MTVALTLFAEPDSAIVRDAATARLAQRAARLGATVDPAAVYAAAVTLHRVDPAVAATLTLGTGAAALAVTAATPGAAGNQMTIALVNPRRRPPGTLAVTVADQALTATLATDTAGAVTTPAAALVTAWAAVPAATALATLALADGSDGTGVLAVAAATSLAGGRDLETVAVERIAAPDGVALQARTLTVEVT